MKKTTETTTGHYLDDSTGVPSWVDRVVKATKPAEDLYFFDWKEAEFRLKFIEQHCRYPEGKKVGQKMKLDQWQKESILFPAFGWKERASGLRRYRNVFLGIPRKNAKTTLTAAIALSIMFQDGEEAAQVYAAAGEKGQAGIIYRAMKYMIEADKLLEEKCRVMRDSAEYTDKRSFVKVLSADARTKHGFNAHAVLFDELHTQPNRDLWDVLTSSMLQREQPITMIMTTAGTDTNSLCYEYWEYSRSVRDGLIVDDRWLSVLFEASASDDWHNPAVWKKANPALGGFLTMKNFRIEYEKALKMPSYINTFKNLHLNIWTETVDSWISDKVWTDQSLDFEHEDVKHLPCFAGLDLASTRDLCSFAAIWVDEPNKRYYLKAHHFVNRAQAETKKLSAGVDYLKFKEEGSLTITNGNATDHEVVLNYIRDFSRKNDLIEVAFDRHLAGFIAPKLLDDGITVVPFGQGYVSMSFPSKEFEKMCLNGTLFNDGSSCLRWQMGCVIIERNPADDIKVTKNRNKNHQKVDGIVASIMALGQFLDYKSRTEDGPSSFEVVGLDF